MIDAAATAGRQTSPIAGRACTSTRNSAANAAAFVAADMNAVTGVGDPSYTSGVHMWNGTTAILNPSPASTSAVPASASRLSGSSATPLAISGNPNDPVAPYRNAAP